jgi:hypothetical protein
MMHNEQVSSFLAARNLTMEAAISLPVEQRKALDAEFRAEKRAAEMAKIEGSIKISRAALRKVFPVGQAITLVYALGEAVSKPRVVAEHKSYGFEMRTPEGKLSGLRHEKGETILLVVKQIENGTRDIVTILDKDDSIVVQYFVDKVR